MFFINLNRSDIVFSIVLLLLILILPNRRIHSIANYGESDYNQQVENNELDKIWFNDYSDNDNFNLFNLFNVFRGTQSKLLDEHGNLIPLDTAKPPPPPIPTIASTSTPPYQSSLTKEQTTNSQQLEAFDGLDNNNNNNRNNAILSQTATYNKRAHPGNPSIQARESNSRQFRLKFAYNLFGAAPDADIQLSESVLNSDINNKPNEINKDKNDARQASSSPIIIVPGYGGTRLEAKLKKPSVVRYFCDLESDWADIWINVKLLLPYMIDCLIDNLRLEYDPVNHTTHNTAGVDIRVKNPNSISSVEYLHQLPLSGFAYFAPVIEKLIDSFNGTYERERNIRGAPYDFRKAPNELEEHFKSIKLNTENLYDINEQKRITYVCHSMGCNQMLYFFHKQSQEWKDKYVRRLISLAAPWAGSFSALRAAALGDDLGMPYLFSESKLIKVQRSLPSTIFLFPHKQVFSQVPLIRANVAEKQHYQEPIIIERSGLGQNLTNTTSSSMVQNESNYDMTMESNSNQPRLFGLNNKKNNNSLLKEDSVVVSTNTSNDELKHYTTDNFESFFDDLNHPDGYKMWLDTKDLLGNLEAPNVEIWCIVGKGQKTLGRMEFLGPFPNSPAIELYDDGDGTVTLESARYCTNWIDKQKQPVIYKEFSLSHMGILKDNSVLELISNILKQN